MPSPPFLRLGAGHGSCGSLHFGGRRHHEVTSNNPRWSLLAERRVSLPRELLAPLVVECIGLAEHARAGLVPVLDSCDKDWVCHDASPSPSAAVGQGVKRNLGGGVHHDTASRLATRAATVLDAASGGHGLIRGCGSSGCFASMDLRRRDTISPFRPLTH